jgi:ferric iron reductase protein FhuF
MAHHLGEMGDVGMAKKKKKCCKKYKKKGGKRCSNCPDR